MVQHRKNGCNPVPDFSVRHSKSACRKNISGQQTNSSFSEKNCEKFRFPLSGIRNRKSRSLTSDRNDASPNVTVLTKTVGPCIFSADTGKKRFIIPVDQSYPILAERIQFLQECPIIHRGPDNHLRMKGFRNRLEFFFAVCLHRADQNLQPRIIKAADCSGCLQCCVNHSCCYLTAEFSCKKDFQKPCHFLLITGSGYHNNLQPLPALQKIPRFPDILSSDAVLCRPADGCKKRGPKGLHEKGNGTDQIHDMNL